jgi:ATP-binding cassette subfamily C (CFTR/MRP) protein 4
VIQNLTLSYPASSKPVLSKINVSFNPGEKIGLVGRTGAGKSSFLLALFRIVEPTPSIFIDDILTSNVDLQTLRSRICIIPQEPFLFKGSLRFNLDPFYQYSDKHLWDVLAAVELKVLAERLPRKLDSEVVDGGANFRCA